MNNVSLSPTERSAPRRVPVANDRPDGELIGASHAMQEVFRLIERVGPTDATVLLTGDSGTGKELAARSIHEASPRRGQAFVSINCGAIPSHLIEAELFGVEPDAAGVQGGHVGMLQRAHGGTLLLDEVTDMPMEMQVRLLRALESKKFYRVGATT